MLSNIQLENIIFLDIETVPQHRNYDELRATLKKLWDHKAERIRWQPDETPESLYQRAGIYAEFGKIICIVVARIHKQNILFESFCGDDEKIILSNFINYLNKTTIKNNTLLCAHNGKEFDFPYLSRRIIVNELILPATLDNAGKKPWEVQHLDTMELWKFGDYKHYTSLELLATIFNINSPKDEINGGDISNIYWKDHDLEKIKNYCQNDVLALAGIYLRYTNNSIKNFKTIII